MMMDLYFANICLGKKIDNQHTSHFKGFSMLSNPTKYQPFQVQEPFFQIEKIKNIL